MRIHQTEHWKWIRGVVLDRAGGKCERCKDRPAAHVHHKTYDRAGNEAVGDLEALCLRCHGLEHGTTFLSAPIQRALAKVRRRNQKGRNRLYADGITTDEARAILKRREAKILRRRGA